MEEQDKKILSVGVFAAIFDEQRRILCVKRNYGPKNWTTPGGAVDKGESPLEAFKREVREETGYLVKPTRLIGVYSAPFKNDLVLSIEAEIVSRKEWQPDGEINEVKFFSRDELPQPMHSFTLTRIQDAFEGKTGIIRVFKSE